MLYYKIVLTFFCCYNPCDGNKSNENYSSGKSNGGKENILTNPPVKTGHKPLSKDNLKITEGGKKEFIPEKTKEKIEGINTKDEKDENIQEKTDWGKTLVKENKIIKETKLEKKVEGKVVDDNTLYIKSNSIILNGVPLTKVINEGEKFLIVDENYTNKIIIYEWDKEVFDSKYKIEIEEDIKKNPYIIAIVEVKIDNGKLKKYIISCLNFVHDDKNGLFGHSSIVNIKILESKKVINMSAMFDYCTSLTNIDFGNIDTSEVTNMRYMFKECSKLTNINLSNLDTSKVTDMSNMFFACSSLKDINFDNFNTSNVTNMSDMFSGCRALKELNLNNFNTSNVTNMSWMFEGCSSLEYLDINNFNTSKVTDMNSMFSRCSSLKEFNIKNFDTGKVTDMSYMFNECTSLKELNLNNFNTNNVTNMKGMFYGCSSLQELNLEKLNTNNVTNMSDMFYGCSSLKELNLNNFNTSNVTNMSEMFEGCSSLKELNLNNFNTNNVTDMYFMFYGCSSLKELNLNNFNINNKTTIQCILYGCSNLKSGKIILCNNISTNQILSALNKAGIPKDALQITKN